MDQISGSRPAMSVSVPRREDRARLSLFGPLRIEVAGRPPVTLSGRSGELLAYLAVHAGNGRTVPRDVVAFALWPDRPDDSARGALASALHRLRKIVPGSGPWLRADRESLALRDVWVDVEAFGQLAGSSDPADRRAAADLHAEGLLPQLDAEWVEDLRAQLRARTVELLAGATDDLESAGDLARALTWARRWSASDPYDEAAHRAVMGLYGRLGRRAAALDHYEGLVARLRGELDVAPDPTTRELAGRIRSELDVSGRATITPAGIPFVGRIAERRRLLERLDAAGSGRGGLLVVLGEAGIGKSRLLQEIRASAKWRGWQVATGKGEQFGSPGPYAPLGEALRSALPEARADQLRAVVGPMWLARVASLVPEIARATANWPGDDSVASLARAVEKLLGGLGRIAPQLVLLDDVQWADRALWPLLEMLRPGLVDLPVLVVVSGRSDELREQPGPWAGLEAWDRAGIPIVHLEGLGVDELAQLAGGLDGRTRDASEIASLAEASGGNPLLALAIVQSGDLSGETDHRAVASRRDSLDRIFEHRLAALSENARAALEVAAVVGQQFPYDLWQEVAGVLDLSGVVGELESSRLLRLDGAGYAFAHDTLRSLVIWDLSPGRREQLNRAALEAGRRRTPDRIQALLFHAEQLGSEVDIAELAQRAGEQALTGLSFQAAARHFTRALGVLPSDARDARYRALVGRVRALDVLADRDAQRIDLIELHDLAAALGGASRAIETARLTAEFHWAVGEYAAGETAASAALDVAGAAGDTAGQAALLTILGRILREQGRLDEARATLLRARTLFGRRDDAHGAAMALELLAGMAWRLGEHALAARQHAEAAAAFERTGDLRRAANSLNSLGSVLWSLGDYEAARTTHERSLATCLELGDRRGESDNLDNLGGVAWALGDFERAIELYVRALAIRREVRDPRGISISLINLGDTHALTGAWLHAIACYDEAIFVDQSVGVRRNLATALQGKGKALLDAGRAGEARSCLEVAADAHVALGDRDNLLDTRAALARTHHELGDLSSARSVVQEAVAMLDPLDRPALRQGVQLAAWHVAAAAGDSDSAARHLAHASIAMDEFLDALPAHARDRVRSRVPIHRRTEAARRAAARRVQVLLPRVDAPLGRKVSEADLVPVDWTIADPTDDLVPDATRRRHRIATRLLDEAAAQGAVATDDHLAKALGVSRRTILRDAETLARGGRPLATRRRARCHNSRTERRVV